MDRKEAAAYLDTHTPGWADADNAGHHVKAAADPKVRMACLSALTLCQSEPAPKPAKAKAKKPTTTPKEG
tara:strand:- start:1367 stop:1576 length:210 start_codon:yes stop_codon:yes gene_type:complete